MKVRFTLDVEDIKAAARYSYDHYPIPGDFSRKWRWIMIGMGTLIFVSQLLIKNYSFQNIFCFALIIGLGIFSPSIFKASCKWHLCLNKKQIACVDPLEYEITEEGMLFSQNSSQTLLKWNGIEDVVCGEDYTFIRIQSVIGHVFPKNKYSPGEYTKFTSELMSRWKNGKTVE